MVVNLKTDVCYKFHCAFLPQLKTHDQAAFRFQKCINWSLWTFIIKLELKVYFHIIKFVFLFWKLKKYIFLHFMIHCKLLFLSVFWDFPSLFLPLLFLFLFFLPSNFHLFLFRFPFSFFLPFLTLFPFEFLPHFVGSWIFSQPKKQGICKNIYPCFRDTFLCNWHQN